MELWAFTMALSHLVGPSTIHTDSMDILDGSRRGEEGGIGHQKKPICGSQIWELLLQGSENNWDLDAKHVQAHRTEQEKEAMTAEGTSVVDGNEKADELPKDGADVDGSALAAAKFLTINQCRKDMSASAACAAHFHVHVEEWKDRDDTVPNEEQTWQFVPGKTRRREIQVHEMREEKQCGE